MPFLQSEPSFLAEVEQNDSSLILSIIETFIRVEIPYDSRQAWAARKSDHEELKRPAGPFY
jgi:hypothetical protein